MTNELIQHDPIIAQNFFLEIDDINIVLSSVSGLDIEASAVTMSQTGPKGHSQTIKTRGGVNKFGDLTISRMAPKDSTSDPVWKWFKDITTVGMSKLARDMNRKNGSVVLFDTSGTEVSRFNFFNGWPSKISTSEVSTDSEEPLKETITLVIERLERVK